MPLPRPPPTARRVCRLIHARGVIRAPIVCFRYRPPADARDDAALDALNKRIMETVQGEGLAFVTNAVIGGRFALRACVLHFATTEADLAALIAAVRDAGQRLAG